MIAKDIKRGDVVVYNESPCIIESVSVQTPSARGAATVYKFRARNLITKQKVDITLRGGDSLKDADFKKREVKYMYSEADSSFFWINWTTTSTRSRRRTLPRKCST